MFRAKKNTKISFILGSALVITACSTPKKAITSKPVGITKTASYVKTGITEMQAIEVRTYTGEKQYDLTEIENSNCELKGRGYSAKVITPAIVNIPVYGKSSSSISAHCVNEKKVGTKIIEIENFDLRKRRESTQAAGYAGGLIGSLIASGITASMKEREGDKYTYKPISITISENK